MLTLLNPDNPDQPFPSVDNALQEPDGLLAVGGCLSVQRLSHAYRQGIFPWYSPGEPILWWSPDPRLVLYPSKLKISKSLHKAIKKNRFKISYDLAFSDVINACSQPRATEENTWISEEMKSAYTQLHKLNIAHSVEAWLDDNLVGGLYGISIGKVFYGESMFHRRTNASKIAFVELVKKLESWGYQLIDCQVRTEHLISLGAEEIPRDQFIKLLNENCDKQPDYCAWQNQ